MIGAKLTPQDIAIIELWGRMPSHKRAEAFQFLRKMRGVESDT
ncbi:hypothetical protein TRP8649_01373 [Pelagimonas phthalicica]|uniref:Uncharacterized protein n=1 Tax=Pelagimonas phthalicica TaxID=1037362 RepID=A0A238J979_9RHOB|nr:hypothetical protein CLV87_0699 [Pelagimonas phthalicica]SMX27270.1 hypothetical protein TRP8649_01373 [Pelagimonas phthalicica]